MRKKDRTKEIEWLKNNICKFKNRKELHEAFNKHFNTTYHEKSIDHFIYDNNLKTNYRKNTIVVWEEEHIEWLIANKDNYQTRQEILKDFNKTFNKNNTLEQLKTLNRGRKLNLNKIKTNNVEYGAGNQKKIFSEIKRHRITIIKTEEKNWMSKAKYLYQKYNNCKVNDDECIIHLNNNKNDYSIENLYKVKKYINAYLGKRNWFYNNPQLTLARVKWCELNREIINLERNSKNNV